MQPQKSMASSAGIRFWEYARKHAVVTMESTCGPLSNSDWCDLNFLLAETLREKYDPKNLVRLEFRGIPDTDEEYAVTAEIVVKKPVRLHPVRRTPRERKVLPKINVAQAKDTLPEVVFTLDLNRVEGLSEEDKELLICFNRLPLRRRISILAKIRGSALRVGASDGSLESE